MSRPIIRVVSASMDDVQAFAPCIRESDRQEILAVSGNTPEAAIRQGITVSAMAWAAYCDEGPLCVFGIAPTTVLEGVGVPWFMSTDLIEKYQFSFVRLTKQYLSLMRESYPQQANYVDDRHEASKRWLRWLGYTLEAPEPYGVAGLPFRLFWYRGSASCVPLSC